MGRVERPRPFAAASLMTVTRRQGPQCPSAEDRSQRARRGPAAGSGPCYSGRGSVLVEDSSLTQAGKACCTAGSGVWLHCFPLPAPRRKSRVCESGKRMDRKLQITAARTARGPLLPQPRARAVLGRDRGPGSFRPSHPSYPAWSGGCFSSSPVAMELGD